MFNAAAALWQMKKGDSSQDFEIANNELFLSYLLTSRKLQQVALLYHQID